MTEVTRFVSERLRNIDYPFAVFYLLVPACAVVLALRGKWQAALKVGYLCLHKWSSGDTLFIADIYVFAPYRSQGFGTKALAWTRQKARRLGCTDIRLHVFGHNQGAIDLYPRCGFKATIVDMRMLVE